MAINKLTYLGANDETVSPANSGFTAIINSDPGGTMLFDDEWMPRGRPSIISTGSDQTGQQVGYKDIPSTDTFSFDIPWRPIIVGTAPNADNQIAYCGTGETRCFQINTLSTGGLRIRDGAGTQTNSPTGLFPVSATNSLVLAYAVLRHASAGAWRVVLYDDDHQTVIWDSGTVSGVNTGAAGITRFRAAIGKQGSTSVTPARHAWGEPRWDPASSSILPRFQGHRPFYQWIDGQYVNVDVYTWLNGDYVQLGTP